MKANKLHAALHYQWTYILLLLAIVAIAIYHYILSMQNSAEMINMMLSIPFIYLLSAFYFKIRYRGNRNIVVSSEASKICIPATVGGLLALCFYDVMPLVLFEILVDLSILFFWFEVIRIGIDDHMDCAQMSGKEVAKHSVYGVLRAIFIIGFVLFFCWMVIENVQEKKNAITEETTNSTSQLSQVPINDSDGGSFLGAWVTPYDNQLLLVYLPLGRKYIYCDVVDTEISLNEVITLAQNNPDKLIQINEFMRDESNHKIAYVNGSVFEYISYNHITIDGKDYTRVE